MFIMASFQKNRLTHPPMVLRMVVGPASRNQESVRGSLLVPQLRSFGACSGFLIDTCPLGTRR